MESSVWDPKNLGKLVKKKKQQLAELQERLQELAPYDPSRSGLSESLRHLQRTIPELEAEFRRQNPEAQDTNPVLQDTDGGTMQGDELAFRQARSEQSASEVGEKVRRTELQSELADFDEQIRTLERSKGLSAGEILLRKGYLEHQRKKGLLRITILNKEGELSTARQELESEQKRYEQTQNPVVLKGLVKREILRQMGSALGGGRRAHNHSVDRTPEQRVIEKARGALAQAREALLRLQASLDLSKTELAKLESQDGQWTRSLEMRCPKPRNLHSAQVVSNVLRSEAISDEVLPPSPAPLPKSVQDSAAWKDIEISFLSDLRVQIRNGSANETCNYAELGFADQRSGKPRRGWIFLSLLAEKEGTIGRPINSKEKGWPSIEKRIQEIRKVLRRHFGLSSDPIPFVENVGYRTRFKLARRRSFDS